MHRRWRLPAIIAGALALLLTSQTMAAAGERAKPEPVGVAELSKLVSGGGPDGVSKAAKGAPPGKYAVSAGSASTALAPDAGCNLSFDKSITEFPQSDGGVSVAIVFSSTIDCSADVQFDGASFLINRTQPFDGQIIMAGNEVFGSGRATSTGAFFIGSVYPGANDVETVFAAYLYSPFGWAGCNPSPGVRVLRCIIDPLDPTLLYTELGSGPYSSKKKDPGPVPTPQQADLRLYYSGEREDNFSTGTTQGANDAVAAGYGFVRNEGRVFTGPAAGTVPLRLFYSGERGDNFSTATDAGAADATAAGYGLIRVEGYVYPTQQPGTVPLELYWNPARGDNFTTATADGKASALAAGYTFIRVEGYVLPNP